MGWLGYSKQKMSVKIVDNFRYIIVFFSLHFYSDMIKSIYRIFKETDMKKITAILLIFFMCVGLFACNDGELDTLENLSDEETEAPTEKGTEDMETVTGGVTEGTGDSSEGTGDSSEGDTYESDEESESNDDTEENSDDETEGKTEEMTADVLNDGLASVGEYDKYDMDTYMSPIWDGRVVHNETVMFVGMEDKAPLLYTPDKIISVRSYDLAIEYEEGIDYKLEDGKLVLLEGTRIPVCPLETYYSVHNNMPYLSTMYNGQMTQTMYGEGTTMTRWQVAVTYKHSDTWDGIKLDSYADRYADLINKLEKGEDVTIFFYGDSITTGANASGQMGVGPYMPSWAVMVTQYIAKQYGYTVKYVDSYNDTTLTDKKPSGGGPREDSVYGNNGIITYINTAVGGWSTQQGNTHFEAYVKDYIDQYGCDLFVLAFGMNNGSSTSREVAGYLKTIIDKVIACNRETDVLIVSPMLPNPEAVRNPADTFFCNGNQSTFEPEMLILSETLNNKLGVNCAVAPLTSVTKYIHSQKRFRDTTGNNVNHPSDFVVRAYAQTIYQTLFGYDNKFDDAEALDTAPIIDSNYNAMIETPGQNTYIDGISATVDANRAVCVRLEAATGGYYIYYISENSKVYINADGSEIVYSSEAKTVWAYSTVTKRTTCADADSPVIMLTAPEICIHPVLAGSDAHGRVACIRCGVKARTEQHTFADSKEIGADGSTIYAEKCTSCGYVLKSYTVPAGINQYISVNDINSKANGSSRINYSEIITDESGTYSRIYGGAGVNYNEFLLYSNSAASNITGQFLVIKYRVGENGRGQKNVTIYAGTINAGPTNETEGIRLNGTASDVEDGIWHTAIVDMSTMTNGGFSANAQGEYRAKFIAIRPLYISTTTPDDKDDYMDIAFAAICDSLESAKKLCDGGEYEYYTTDKIPEIVTK